MSEPFLERMSQFTPDAAGLDRDTLLFAAGRASARPNRGLLAFATLLTSTQVLSFIVIWSGATVPGDRLNVAAVAPSPAPAPATVDPEAARLGAAHGTWPTRRGLRDAEAADRADDTVSLMETGPTLRASGPLPKSLLN